MQTHTIQLLNQFKNTLTRYARNYFIVNGHTPKAADCKKMIQSAFDKIEDPKIRATMRAAIIVEKLVVDKQTIKLEYGISKKYIEFFDKYLA